LLRNVRIFTFTDGGKSILRSSMQSSAGALTLSFLESLHPCDRHLGGSRGRERGDNLQVAGVNVNKCSYLLISNASVNLASQQSVIKVLCRFYGNAVFDTEAGY